MVARVEAQITEVIASSGETLHQFSWASVTATGLVVRSRDVSWETYDETVQHLLAMDNASQWAIGDAYNWGESIFTKRDPSQVFSARKVKIKTIQNYAWVCNRYSYLERMWPPSFSHHAVVAKLPPERRYYWLLRAVDEDLTVEALSALTAEERGLSAPVPSPFTMLVDYYNSMLNVFKRLPDYPEKQLIQRGLKLLEQGIIEAEKRLHG